MNAHARAYRAGCRAATRAIADGTAHRMPRELRPTAKKGEAWDEFLAGWIAALREDRERKVTWDKTYPPTERNE